MNEAPVRLERAVFKTSRLLDFVGRRELTAQVGHDPTAWPLVILKELFDNALDACEEAEIAPEIKVEVSTASEAGLIRVDDNGPGLPPEVVTDILDYSVRVSSREAYVSPTRGAQGNALKTIIAMPYALDGACGSIVLESRGVTHRITFSADQVRQTPRIDHRTENGGDVGKNGTGVAVYWPRDGLPYLTNARRRFLQTAEGYAVLNPHLSLEVQWDGEVVVRLTASGPSWLKWRACDPTSPHWYTPAHLARLAGAHLAHDQDQGRPPRTVRAFVSEFYGLSSTAKQKVVSEEAGLVRQPLTVLFQDGAADEKRIRALLGAMQKNSRPIRPRALGVIGEAHLLHFCTLSGASAETFRYRVVAGETDDGIPFVVEAAFAATLGDGEGSRRLMLGINFAAALGNPYRVVGTGYDGLETILAEQRCDRDAPIVLVLHLVCARIGYQDRGKSSVVLDRAIGEAIAVAVGTITGPWSKQQKAQERNDRRAIERYRREVAAAAAKPERPKNTVVGSGVLYREIEAAAAASGSSIKALTVLSPKNDPYRLDTTVGHALGEWLAEQIEHFIGAERRVHLRGLLYVLVSAGNVLKPDGRLFVNTHDNWLWLGRAAKAARWLRYVPFNRIRDERNEGPRLFLPTRGPAVGDGTFARGALVEVPPLGAVLPYLQVTAPRGAQPYRIVLIGEKSSLADVLEPIARIVEGELLLPTGEATETMIAEMVARAVEDGRPTVGFHFDPAGWQMAISVARKLQGLRALYYPDLKIEMRRVALTLDQVHQFALPSTPLKDTERRASRWRQVMHHEQTEIDSLAALRPDDLSNIALAAVEPFYDFTLAVRCEEAAAAWRREAEAKIDGHPSLTRARKKIAVAHTRVGKAIEALRKVQDAAQSGLAAELGIEPASIPVPEAEIEAIAPPPLFTTADDFATASLKLIADKKYEGEESEDDE